MNKAETLEHLHNAKKAHVKWVQRAKALIEGLPVEKEAIPVDCTDWPVVLRRGAKPQCNTRDGLPA
jgi:hypothetical protein